MHGDDEKEEHGSDKESKERSDLAETDVDHDKKNDVDELSGKESDVEEKTEEVDIVQNEKLANMEEQTTSKRDVIKVEELKLSDTRDKMATTDQIKSSNAVEERSATNIISAWPTSTSPVLSKFCS